MDRPQTFLKWRMLGLSISPFVELTLKINFLLYLTQIWSPKTQNPQREIWFHFFAQYYFCSLDLDDKQDFIFNLQFL